MPPDCHSERIEESTSTFNAISGVESSAGFFASLRMTGSVVTTLFLLFSSHAQSPTRPASGEQGRTETAAPPPTSQTSATPPAKNWVLPLFTDKEGFRTMTLRGSAVQSIGANRIDITDLNITVFSGDAEARVDNVLLAQSASFFPKTNLATGEAHVRLIRDDLEISGDGWTYDHAAKKISLKQNARVVFRAELNDILK
jgi:hypothetical protein